MIPSIKKGHRKAHIYVASGLVLGQLFVFALSSMSGPHQLEFFGINLAFDLGLILVAAF